MKYLWDTNTAIYFLQEQFPSNAEQFIDSTLQDSTPSISVITEIELLCWKNASEEELEVMHNFINGVTIFNLEDATKYKTVEIRKVHKIKLPDAVIAATALVYKQILLTRNTKDFKNIIPPTQLINPFEQ